MSDHGWVRFHDTPGRVIGCFTGEYAGEQRDLVTVQTVTGIEVWPASALLEATEDDAITHAARHMARVVEGLDAAGLDTPAMHRVFEQAIALHGRLRERELRARQQARDPERVAALRAAAHAHEA